MKEERIANLMVGRELGMRFPEIKPNPFDETVLSVEGFTHEEYFENISFTLRKGEILGVSGLIGSGRTELALALFGSIPVKSGTLFIEGEEVKITGPGKAIAAGIGYLTEDRKKWDWFLNFRLAENMLSIDIETYSVRRIVTVPAESSYSRVHETFASSEGPYGPYGNMSGEITKILLSRSYPGNSNTHHRRATRIIRARGCSRAYRELAEKCKSIFSILDRTRSRNERQNHESGQRKIVDIMKNGS
jgi:ABC-type sugar transport system ATPase subunit